MTMADSDLTQEDTSLILRLAGSAACSLESAPGDDDNWVESAGGLPNYICEVATGVMRSGKSKGQSIAIAISRIKRWAAGGEDVKADTRARAIKALAQWEALKARNKANRVSTIRL